MSSPWGGGGGRHGPGTAGGDSHAAQLMFFQMLTPAEEPPEINEAVSACGFLFFCFGSVWDGAQDLSTVFDLVGFAPVNVHQAYPHCVPESVPRKS